MDTGLSFSDSDDYSNTDEDDHNFSNSYASGSDSGSESFDSDFDPETLRTSNHKKIETPRPSLGELQGIIDKLDLDHEFMLNEDTKEEETDDDIKSDTNNNKRRNSIKHTENVEQKKIGKRWYINQYLCYKYLGKGSFGKVCLAKNIIKKEKVAIKVLNKSILRRKRILRKNKPPSNMLENIFREIAIMKKLNHPNVLQIYEVIDDPTNDKLYMIIDYMDSGSVLGEKGAEAKCEPITDHELIRKYIRDMILGLDYLHSNDIIHGDIKPENLLLSNDDHLKIADFGVSFMLDSETCPNKDGKVSRSQGTPAFTAPETGSKSFLAYPIDIWAMGVTLYMMITGICPFAGNGIYDTYEKIQKEHPPIPTNIDDDLKDFMQQILLKDPAKRITLKDAMKHEWITKKGSDPLFHPAEYQTRKRVSVTKEEIQYAVNLPSNTIKHLRRASIEIDNKQAVEMELDETEVVKKKSIKKKKKKSGNKTPSKPTKAPPKPPKSSTKKAKKPKKPSKKAPVLSKQNKSKKSKTNVTAARSPKSKRNTAKGPKTKSNKSKSNVSPRSPKSKSKLNSKAKAKNKALPTSPKNKKGKKVSSKKNKLKSPKTVESNSNISPSFAKRRTGSDLANSKSSKIKIIKQEKTNAKKPKSKTTKNKPLPK